ncbi:MAG TPA: hypothetical protein VF251_13270 [Pyrinomonadaceae bacterium]
MPWIKFANPAIAVNRDGIVAVSWNDRRDDPQARCWRLYAALSVDGGEHFLPAQRLSSAPTCTNTPSNWETSGDGFNSDQSGQYLAHFESTATVPTRFPMGGDTSRSSTGPTDSRQLESLETLEYLEEVFWRKCN